MNRNLSFICEEDLKKHVLDTILKYDEALKGYDLKKFNKNIIDPIKLTFDKNVYNASWEEIIRNELYRQKDKTNSNLIGYFHQNLFKYIEKCEVPTSGFDIIFDSKVYVEMKNKHNTMNDASSKNTYIKMQNHILNNPNDICYLVEVISKKRENEVWGVTIDKVKMSNGNIRRVPIDIFMYEVTGEKNAFKRLCDVLPHYIDSTIGELKLSGEYEQDSVFNELLEMDEDISKSLYKLAFGEYLSF